MVPSQSNAVLCFVKVTENALIPTRGSRIAAGLDLRIAYDKAVPARGKLLAL